MPCRAAVIAAGQPYLTEKVVRQGAVQEMLNLFRPGQLAGIGVPQLAEGSFQQLAGAFMLVLSREQVAQHGGRERGAERVPRPAVQPQATSEERLSPGLLPAGGEDEPGIR